MSFFNGKNIVALDLETTGLDSNKERIIEIGALKISNGEIVDRFCTLVNPGMKIPYSIQRLTNITPEMLEDAPSEKESLIELIGFIGNCTVLGQNISFDIDFVTNRSIQLDIPVKSFDSIDTLTMARVLYPRLVGYNLGALSKFFKIDLDNAHRAEDDARAAYEVAVNLWDKLISLSPFLFNTLKKIILSAGENTIAKWINEAARSEDIGVTSPPEIDSNMILHFDNVKGETPREKASEMNMDELLSYLEDDSPLGEIIDGFTSRDVQLTMAERVYDTLKYDMFLVVEAGTGTGKSFAYMLPAIAFASGTGNKVVVSTKTKNLQEQLFFKDIPTLEKILPNKFRYLLLKGRGNYICLNRFYRLLADIQSLRFDEKISLAKLVMWANETQSGDIAEANSFSLFRYPGLWAKIRSESITCSGKKCPYYDKCYLQRVRQAVEDSQIIVVNHSLLFAEMADSSVLGEFDHAIIDEAHDLEEVAAEFFGDQVSNWNILDPLNSLFRGGSRPRGLLTELSREIGKLEEIPGDFNPRYKILLDEIVRFSSLVDSVFADISNNLQTNYNWMNAPYILHQRYNSEEPVFYTVRSELVRLSKGVESVLEKARSLFFSVPDGEDENLDRVIKEINGQFNRLTEISQALDIMLNPDTLDSVFWWESPSRANTIDAKICWAPLDVAERMYNVFHSQKKSVVFTSATLSVANSFEYIIHRLGLEFIDMDRVEPLQLGSPYDFGAQLKALWADFLPFPNENNYSKALAELIEGLSRTTRAGTLALFTSYRMLKQVYQYASSNLAKEGILMMGQGITGGRSQLTRQFTEDKESVLLGTQSFWQGVDIKGDALKILFVTKLPFNVPTDPYFSAQCERITMNGGDPFSSYTVPQAVIKFRQGIGRLIRGEEDVGALIICDKRVGCRSYGRVFVESLPVSVERVMSKNELISKIERFF